MGVDIVKKIVVISGINLFEGGGLSILKECLSELNDPSYEEYEIKFLVHDKNLLNQEVKKNITFIEFPLSRKSYFFRFYYEYYKFKQLSKAWNVYLWLSLHDISPFVKAKKQAVYCHNPSLFRAISIKDIYLQPTLFFFTIFYKFIYKINIKSNKYIILQSSWMRNAFSDLFSISKECIVVAKPISTIPYTNNANDIFINKKTVFFYPAFPRSFKNFEIIGEACKILQAENITNFIVYLTLDGSENKYSKLIYKKYKDISSMNFLGLLNREEVFDLYKKSDVLIFPSTLETWGLPISEFKVFNKPILLVDLPYAYETLGDYQKVNFFDANNPKILAELMKNHIYNMINYDGNKVFDILQPFASNWNELFQILLQDK